MTNRGLPPRTDARLTLHGYPGAERLQWSLLLLSYDTNGIPETRLLDRGVVGPLDLPEDLAEALWAVLAEAVPHSA